MYGLRAGTETDLERGRTGFNTFGIIFIVDTDDVQAYHSPPRPRARSSSPSPPLPFPWEPSYAG